MRQPLVLDIETAPLDNAADFLEPVQAAKNLKDPEKIKADLDARAKEQLEKCGLDWNVSRIVALGLFDPDQDEKLRVWCCHTEAGELDALVDLWELVVGRAVLGFRIKDFDYPFLLQRSRYLGVRSVPRDLGRYSRDRQIIDLYHELTFNDLPCTWVMRRTLKSFAKRLGIPVEDGHDGKDMQMLVAAGDWDAIAAHCESDVRLTVAVALKLGLLFPATVAL